MITLLCALIGAAALVGRLTVNAEGFEGFATAMDFLVGVLVFILAIVAALEWLS